VSNVPTGGAPVSSVNSTNGTIVFANAPNNYYVNVNLRILIVTARATTNQNNIVSINDDFSSNWRHFAQDFYVPVNGVDDGDELNIVFGFITPPSGADATVRFRIFNLTVHTVQIVGVAIYGWKALPG
jgi:hypothetical protein